MLASAYMRAARDRGRDAPDPDIGARRGPVRRANRRRRDHSRAYRVRMAGRRCRHLGGGCAPVGRRRSRGQSAQESLLVERTRRGALARYTGRLPTRRTRVPAPGRRRIAARDSGVGVAGIRRTTTARRHVRAGAHRRGGLGVAGRPCPSDQTLLPRLRRVALRAPHRGPDDLYTGRRACCSAPSPAWKGCSLPEDAAERECPSPAASAGSWRTESSATPRWSTSIACAPTDSGPTIRTPSPSSHGASTPGPTRGGGRKGLLVHQRPVLLDVPGRLCGRVDVPPAVADLLLEIAHQSLLSGTGRTSCCSGRRAYTADELH